MTEKTNKLQHPCFPQPINTGVRVWKYMDLGKLISTISKKSLFLCRLDLLGDLHEGSITKATFMERQDSFSKQGITRWASLISDENKRKKKSFFVNCWRHDDFESEAMWKLYCPDNNGIALQTTYQKLVEAISFDDQLYIGLIKYIDYETEWFPSGNLFFPVMHKRKGFEHEKEVRLVKSESKYWDPKSEEPPQGLLCPWELTKSIENIYVNPYADNWYYEAINDLLITFDIKINIIWSSLKGIPYF